MKNIKEILNGFDEIKPLGLTTDDKLISLGEGDLRVLKAYQQQIRLFISSSLTSLLEGLKESLPKIVYSGDKYWEDDMNAYRQEVIKLIDNFTKDSLDKPKNYYTHTCGIVGCNGDECIK